MGLGDALRRLTATLLIERPVRHREYTQLAARLQETGRRLEARLERSPDKAENREALRHIIGIERWGQRRLSTLLGEPLRMDEYDAYRPDVETDWETLQQIFRETRRLTVALAQRLQAAAVARSRRVPHNDFGELSPHGWLRYLTFHANAECRRIR